MAALWKALMTQVGQPSDVPTGPHFVIILFGGFNVHHEGDERSRTHPGHGYPAYNERVETREMYVTTDRATWERAIQEIYREDIKRKDVLLYCVTHFRIEPSVTINVVDMEAA